MFKEQVVFICITLTTYLIYCQNNLTQPQLWYNPLDYDQNDIYNLMAIPSGSSYQSNNTCVSFADLVNYNYTDYFEKWNNWNKIIPENFCYSMLTYNISRDDFFKIVDKNIQAFYNYKKLITMWSLSNFSSTVQISDSCVGYFRNVACRTQFPARVDNGDGTWVRIN